MSTPRRPRSERRTAAIGGAVALALSVLAGSAFGLLGPRNGTGPDEPTERTTERAVATLPEPDAAPKPVEDHFPDVAGLELTDADTELVAGLEQRLQPAEGDFAESQHRELHDDEGAVAVISLLRVEGEEAALLLRREALDGLAELFDDVDQYEVGDEPVVRGASLAGVALLWLPDDVSVLMVSAVDAGSAETVMGEVVGSVRDEDGDDEVALRS